MKKIYHLSTCNTCQRIIKETGLAARDDFEFQDIKAKKISPEELEQMREMTENYEELFSRRSRSYRTLGLHEKQLSEADMKALILEDYTFLKRPVTIIDDQIFIGNAKKVVESLKEALA